MQRPSGIKVSPASLTLIWSADKEQLRVCQAQGRIGLGARYLILLHVVASQKTHGHARNRV